MTQSPEGNQLFTTTNTHFLEQLVQQDYSLGKSIRCSLIRSKDNDNFLVQTKYDKFVLRVYRYRKHWLTDESDYLFELEWLAFLHHHGLPVSFPIQRRDGGYLSTLESPEGVRYWAIFSYAPGNQTLTPAQARRFGESIAQIHLASNAFESSHPRFHADLTWLLDQSVHRLDQFLDHQHRYISNYVSEIAKPLREAIDTIPFTGDEYGIIGGDFHGDNHHFAQDDEITHFDFDLCSYGWRAYDLAVFRSVRGKSQQIWHNALSGYQSIRALSPNEMKAIPTFVLIRHIWVMGSVTTYKEAPKLLESGLWDQWFETLKMYESGAFIID